MIELKIDNQTIAAQEGETVLQAALRSGIEIPHFCYHPCLSVAGNCRICLVKVDGRPKLVPSCNQAVAPGMVVETDTEEVRAARAAVLQFIAINHPGECGICDKAGECRLQDYQVRFGEAEPLAEEPRSCKPKFYELGERILLDSERCILCSRCVRFTQELSGSNQLGIAERGNHARVQTLEQQPFDDPYGDNIVGLCPVGALLSRDFLYKSRVWYLEAVRSVCSGCARCCSVNVWRRNRHWQVRSLDQGLNHSAYRITPFENPEINGRFLCNKGYDLHKAMARPRLSSPQVRGREVAVEEALALGRQLLSEAKKPAALVSAQASNEELAAFQAAFGERLSVYTRRDCQPALGEVLEDGWLIRADKNPNSRGVAELFGERPWTADAGHDLVLVWGECVDYAPYGDPRVIHLAAFASGREAEAELFIPLSTPFERDGSYTNCDGIVNRFEKVFDKPASAQHAGDIFGRLGA
ncbi:NADH dehydrogenase [Desulfuromonas versatilis]|uniref:NADH dehydrogenase n=1 Tax=Desulfuromonas versatilis TaxID=2802975 RepID=A0ABN6E010_9BACT|nr:2Fe-2S iron-sulfur cluster-binding protein [Desulfuromonas versatilis]BCR05690.1 NADH dehydrogenase [Desulfuromonas versatilis]